jgi:hypothetical protein
MRNKIKIPPKLTKLLKFKECYLFIPGARRHKRYDVIRFLKMFFKVFSVFLDPLSVSGDPFIINIFKIALMFSTLVEFLG